MRIIFWERLITFLNLGLIKTRRSNIYQPGPFGQNNGNYLSPNHIQRCCLLWECWCIFDQKIMEIIWVRIIFRDVVYKENVDVISTKIMEIIWVKIIFRDVVYYENVDVISTKIMEIIWVRIIIRDVVYYENVNVISTKIMEIIWVRIIFRDVVY